MAAGEQALQMALAAYQRQAWDEALRQGERGVRLMPARGDGWNLLGAVLRQQGEVSRALEAFTRAIELKPDVAEYHRNLGNLLLEAGRPQEAMVRYQKTLDLAPDSQEDALRLLRLLNRQRLFAEAGALAQKMIARWPALEEPRFLLGNALREQGRPQEAISSYQAALACRPDFPEALINLAGCLCDLQQFDQAKRLMIDEIRRRPERKEAMLVLIQIAIQQNNLTQALELCQMAENAWGTHLTVLLKMGFIHFQMKRYDLALEVFRQAVALDPDNLDALAGLGVNLYHADRYDEALPYLTAVIARNPDYCEVHNNLGTLYKNLGRIDEAIASFQAALNLRPLAADIHSNLLLCMNYTARYTPEQLYAEHLRFDERHARPLAALIQPHDNDPDPERRLTIGYVSPDFRRHAVSYFTEPVLAHHDHGPFRIIVYYTYQAEDEITQKFKQSADVWRPCVDLSDQELADLIRGDKVDILVDLSGHSSRNRLLAFARKPAPVQVSWIGYPNTTGMATMDYRFSDHVVEPEGAADDLSREKLYRLPGHINVFRAGSWAPEPREAPVFQRGYVTFGSFHVFAKIFPETLAAWARILHGVPGSRLLMECPGLDGAEFRSRVTEAFAGLGIGAERLTLMGRTPQNQYRLYWEVDICLDTFPYNGGTTSNDTIWMGVPFITLAGDRHPARIGIGILTAVGLPELAAQDVEGYVALAVRLGQDREWLRQVRSRLSRERLSGLPIFNGPLFVRNLEQAYRDLWRRWVADR